MKVISLFVLLVLCCAANARAQSVSNQKTESGPVNQTDARAQLQLTTSILEQKYYCSNLVGFTLRLTYRNTGSMPIILDKRSLIGRTMFSRDLNAAAQADYEIHGRFDLFDGKYFDVDPSDMSNFVVLKPGEVYAPETPMYPGSVRIDESTPPAKGHLSTGTHYLQIGVGTWTYFADPTPLQKKWRAKGVLWLKELISEPMPFKIEKERLGSNCEQGKQ